MKENQKTDKLQHEMYWNYLYDGLPEFVIKINYNMRCIETSLCLYAMLERFRINYNMRCIETTILLSVIEDVLG